MKQQTMTILFYLNRAKTNQKGVCPLYCRITFIKKRKEFSTGQFVNPKNWKAKTQKVAVREENSSHLNSQLSFIRQNIKNTYLKLHLQGDEFSVKDIVDVYFGRERKLEDKDSLFYKIGSIQPYSGFFTRKAIKADRKSDWNRNGQTKIEGEIENGQAKGLWIEWHHNGKRISEMNMSKGKPNGSSASWYSNGQKKDEGNYFNGKKEGLWTHWYRYGVTNQKKEEIIFKKGGRNKSQGMG